MPADVDLFTLNLPSLAGACDVVREVNLHSQLALQSAQKSHKDFWEGDLVVSRLVSGGCYFGTLNPKS